VSEIPPDPWHEISRMQGYDLLRSLGAIALARGDIRAAVLCLSDDDLRRLFVLTELHAVAVVMAARETALRNELPGP
jgi:hypothetical protein